MISYNFLICKDQFSKRAIPLYNTVGQQILKEQDDLNLLGSWEDKQYNVLRLADKDDYFSAIDKQINCILHLTKTEKKADWYFFGDDDTFVHTKNLKQFLNSKPTTELQIYGHCYPATDGVMHAHGGAGFVMNRYTLETIGKYLLSKNGEHKKHWKNSDVTIALNVDEYNKQNVNAIEFINEQYVFLASHSCSIEQLDFSKFIAVHVVDRTPFEELYKKI